MSILINYKIQWKNNIKLFFLEVFFLCVCVFSPEFLRLWESVKCFISTWESIVKFGRDQGGWLFTVLLGFWGLNYNLGTIAPLVL